MSWLMNLLSGWLPLGVNSSGQGKSIGEWAGKIIWVVGIVLALMWLDKVFNKPPVQNIQTQIVGEQRDMMGVGCNFMRAYVKAGVKSR